MKFNLSHSIFKILHKPLFGTVVIPKDASVDPKLFPEDDYPVYCSKCVYLLRGLEDGCCPECGSPFARGKLLITQYLSSPWVVPWKSSRLRKISFIIGVIGFLLVGISICGIFLSISAIPSTPSSVNPASVNKAISNLKMYMYVSRVGLFVIGAAVISHLVVLFCYVKYLHQIKDKRRTVRDAIIQLLNNSDQPVDQ